jgi:hypothetical protein
MPNAETIPERLETALARIFAICDANRAAMLKAREDAKLSRRRYWWQDNETETAQTKR